MANKIRHKQLSQGKEEDHVLVYSTDPIPEPKCQSCAQPKSKCKCTSQGLLSNVSIKPVIQIEKKGRGGKVVTLVKRLPTQERFLADLCGHLKRKLGSGGTYYTQDVEGIVEIQGDHRKDLSEIISSYLKK